MRRAIPALCALLGACVAAGDAMPPGATPAERCTRYVDEGLSLDSLTRSALRATLGEPVSTRSTTEPNRHIPDAIDSLFTLTWDGLEVHLRTPPSGGDLVERVTVRDDRYLRWPDPGMGATERHVAEVLGPPQERQPGVVRYACGTGPVDEPVGFVITDARVSAIVFDFYVD